MDSVRSCDRGPCASSGRRLRVCVVLQGSGVIRLSHDLLGTSTLAATAVNEAVAVILIWRGFVLTHVAWGERAGRPAVARRDLIGALIAGGAAASVLVIHTIAALVLVA